MAWSSNGMTRVGEDLEGMATLAGDQHGITATSIRKCRFDRSAAVGLDADLARLVESSQQVARESGRGLRYGGY